MSAMERSIWGTATNSMTQRSLDYGEYESFSDLRAEMPASGMKRLFSRGSSNAFEPG